MHTQDTGTNILTTVAKALNMFVIGVPGRLAGGRIITAFREAGAVSRASAQRFHPSSEMEAAAFRGLVAAEIIRQPEPGRFFLDEDALDDWVGWRKNG
jgi:hypothetical protein